MVNAYRLCIQQNQGRAVSFPVAVCALREHLAKLPKPFRDLSAGLFVTLAVLMVLL